MAFRLDGAGIPNALQAKLIPRNRYQDVGGSSSNGSSLILLKNAILERTLKYLAEFEGPHAVHARH